jgi:acetyl esterase/lipase
MALAQTADIFIQKDIIFASPNGVALKGDFYGPKTTEKSPILVAVHGGGWQAGSRVAYHNWGHYLPPRGFALFSIDYRLSKPGKMYPEAVSDVRAAIHYIRANADTYNIDPDRLGLIGDSAGAHLASLVSLTDQLPGETEPAAGSGNVKAAALFYGVYDMAAQWRHDQLARPTDQITQTFLGTTPMKNRKLFFEASPISHVEQDSRNVAYFLTYGTADNVVDSTTQSELFLDTLAESGKFVRKIVIPFAPHFYSGDPIEEPGSYSGLVAPRLVRFLQEKL